MKIDHRGPIVGQPLNRADADAIRAAAHVEKWKVAARRFEAGFTRAALGIALLLFVWMLVGVAPHLIRHAAGAL